MARPTHYDILGARPSDSPEQLRDAYRRAQKRYHPDLARDAADRVRREAAARMLNESYALLRDPEVRAKYDAALRRSQSLWSRFDPGALVRGRGTWLLRVQLPGVPRMPRTQRIAAIINEIWSTRLGQWSLLLGALIALWITNRNSPLLAALLIGASAVLAALLARGGPPTPATDAESMLSALGRFSEVTARRSHQELRRVRGRLADLRAEYDSRDS